MRRMGSRCGCRRHSHRGERLLIRQKALHRFARTPWIGERSRRARSDQDAGVALFLTRDWIENEKWKTRGAGLGGSETARLADHQIG